MPLKLIQSVYIDIDMFILIRSPGISKPQDLLICVVGPPQPFKNSEVGIILSPHNQTIQMIRPDL